jgi:CelD/BcsL family acetyltransferase involved in cellulose biosynthesis
MARLAPEWHALSTEQEPWLPFLGPTWNLLWWRHLAERSPLIADRICVHALRSSDGGLVAVAPLMLTERPGTGPLRVRMLQFFGADPWMTEARAVACLPGREPAVYARLIDHLQSESSEWDIVRWGGIPTSAAGLVSGIGDHVRIAPSPPAFVLDLPRSWDALKSRLPRNIKESLRKCYNSLRRDGLAVEFRALEGGGDEALAALGMFYDLHQKRARRGDTVEHNDVFRTKRSRAFLGDYFRESPAGSALIFQLLVRGEVIATRIGFRSGNDLYLYYSGYDPEWARYSAMTTLVAEVLKWAMAQGIRAINLSFGRDGSKTRWRPHEVSFQEATWYSPSFRGRMLSRAFTGLEAMRRSNRWNLIPRALLTRDIA